MTNAELAILSLVAETPRHGYEIEQVIEERNMREWTDVGFSSIYFLLKKLERQGWIQSNAQAAAGRGPARKVYRITGDGMAAWRKAVQEALAQSSGNRLNFLLGLSNLPALPSGQAIEALKMYHSNLITRQERLLQRFREIPRQAEHVRAMFDYSLALVREEIKWIETYIAQLEAKLEQDRP